MRRRLAFKLIASLTVAFAIVGGVSQYLNVGLQERQLLDGVVRSADQLSRSIVGATWQAMLVDRRDTAYEVMESIAKRQGVDRIRIFNREGHLMFSTAGAGVVRLDTRAEVCSPCHANAAPLVRLERASRARVFRGEDGSRHLAMITPIYNEPSCSQADCHAHPAGIHVLGVLDVGMDLSHVDQEVRSIQARSLAVSLIEVALAGLIVTVFTRRFVGRPIAEFVSATRAISELELSRPIRVERSDEFAALAQSLELMRSRLQLFSEQNLQFTQRLESMVEERTAQLTAAQGRLIQAGRLASLGQLAASVAHEINNPVSGVLNLAMLLKRIVDSNDAVPPERLPEFRRYLGQITVETARVGRIVADLLSFSRRSARRTTLADLNEIVASTVSLVAHKLELAGVSLEQHLESGLPALPCDPSQIRQVVINLVLNAAEATPRGGLVVVTTGREGDSLFLHVADTGAGIAPAVMERIFEPFFTTKEEGRGVGLGLAVVYGIVEAHRGRVAVKSSVGVGSSFRVLLPLVTPQGDAGPAATVIETVEEER